MLDYTLAALVMAALLQPNSARAIAGAVFVGATVTHDLFGSNLIGLGYYGSAALTDLGIIAMLSLLRPVSQLAINLQVLSFASICLNVYGWIAWMTYEPPAVYNTLFKVFYVWALVVLIWRDKQDVGSGAMGRGFPWFYRGNSSRASNNGKDLGEI